MTKMYMNPMTGSVDDYDGWWYTPADEDGNEVGPEINAVDTGEVIEVVSDGQGGWVEA